MAPHGTYIRYFPQNSGRQNLTSQLPNAEVGSKWAVLPLKASQDTLVLRQPANSPSTTPYSASLRRMQSDNENAGLEHAGGSRD